MTEAKLFKVGGSQAVRLPKEFRFTGDRVRIRKEGNKVILEPMPVLPERDEASIRAWLKDIQTLGGFEGFERPEQPPPQERDWSDFD